MTTELITKNYERLDSYIDRIVYHAQEVGDLIQQYMDTAAQEGIPEAEAKAYLKSKIPKSTFYKYLPNELKDPNKQNRKPEFGPPVDHTVTEESSIEQETQSASTSATGPDGNEVEEEVTQTVNCPTTTTDIITDDEHDKLVARIQELEKMVSDLSFQKGSETPKETAPPAQQIIILPHNMVLDVYQKRMGVGLEGFMQLKTENNIVVGVEIVNVTQTK